MILLIGGLQAFDLWHARRDKWDEGVTSLENIYRTLSTNIERNLALFDLSLIGAQEAVEMAGLAAMDPEIRRRVLFDRSTTAQFVGVMMVVDKDGNVIFDSHGDTQIGKNVSDRTYFTTHKQPGSGLYMSHPLNSRFNAGVPVLGLSRRVSGPDGAFDGVVAGAIRIAYFQWLFEGIKLGPGGVIGISYTDGTVIYRVPSDDGKGDTGAESRVAAMFQSAGSGAGPSVHRGQLDGVERLFVSGQLAGYPLVLTVGTSVSSLFADWNTRALITGAITVLLCMVLAFTVAALGRALRHSEVMESELEQLAVTDPLTDLPNRRAFDMFIAGELRRARRDKTQLAMLMIDVDHFKLVNDRHGHASGDAVLRQMGRLISSSIRRPGDFAARFGGEEFVVVLPVTVQEGAVRVAEAIRTLIENARFQAIDGTPLRVTVSIGVAGALLSDSAVDIVRRADNALYDAKNAGRNQVSTSQRAAA